MSILAGYKPADMAPLAAPISLFVPREQMPVEAFAKSLEGVQKKFDDTEAWSAKVAALLKTDAPEEVRVFDPNSKTYVFAPNPIYRDSQAKIVDYNTRLKAITTAALEGDMTAIARMRGIAQEIGEDSASGKLAYLNKQGAAQAENEKAYQNKEASLSPEIVMDAALQTQRFLDEYGQNKMPTAAVGVVGQAIDETKELAEFASKFRTLATESMFGLDTTGGVSYTAGPIPGTVIATTRLGSEVSAPRVITAELPDSVKKSIERRAEYEANTSLANIVENGAVVGRLSKQQIYDKMAAEKMNTFIQYAIHSTLNASSSPMGGGGVVGKKGGGGDPDDKPYTTVGIVNSLANSTRATPVKAQDKQTWSATNIALSEEIATLEKALNDPLENNEEAKANINLRLNAAKEKLRKQAAFLDDVIQMYMEDDTKTPEQKKALSDAVVQEQTNYLNAAGLGVGGAMAGYAAAPAVAGLVTLVTGGAGVVAAPFIQVGLPILGGIGGLVYGFLDKDAALIDRLAKQREKTFAAGTKLSLTEANPGERSPYFKQAQADAEGILQTMSGSGAESTRVLIDGEPVDLSNTKDGFVKSTLGSTKKMNSFHYEVEEDGRITTVVTGTLTKGGDTKTIQVESTHPRGKGSAGPSLWAYESMLGRLPYAGPNEQAALIPQIFRLASANGFDLGVNGPDGKPLLSTVDVNNLMQGDTTVDFNNFVEAGEQASPYFDKLKRTFEDDDLLTEYFKKNGKFVNEITFGKEKQRYITYLPEVTVPGEDPVPYTAWYDVDDAKLIRHQFNGVPTTWVPKSAVIAGLTAPTINTTK